MSYILFVTGREIFDAFIWYSINLLPLDPPISSEVVPRATSCLISRAQIFEDLVLSNLYQWISVYLSYRSPIHTHTFFFALQLFFIHITLPFFLSHTFLTSLLIPLYCIKKHTYLLCKCNFLLKLCWGSWENLFMKNRFIIFSIVQCLKWGNIKVRMLLSKRMLLK